MYVFSATALLCTLKHVAHQDDLLRKAIGFNIKVYAPADGDIHDTLVDALQSPAVGTKVSSHFK